MTPPIAAAGPGVTEAEQLRQALRAALPRLRRIARCLAGDVEEADELVRTTIERALAGAAGSPDAAPLQPDALRKWLFGILRKAWPEQRRALRRRGNGEAAQATGAARPAPPQAVHAAMARLPAKQRLAVALVLVEGLSWSEAAQLLDVTVDTLASHLARGRETLAAQFAEPGRETDSDAHHWSNAEVQAFVDGELDAGHVAPLAAQVRQDLALAQRVARERALRTRVADAFNVVLHEPVPARLLEAVEGRRGPGHASGRLPGPWWWSAAAAGLLAAWLAGWHMARDAREPLVLRQSGLEADGVLAGALSDRLSAEGSKAGVLVSLSFRAGDGRYCRAFSLDSGIDGLACRDGRAWRVEATGRSLEEADAAAPYRQASSQLSPAVLAAMYRWQAGNALTREQERQAREADWQRTP